MHEQLNLRTDAELANLERDARADLGGNIGAQVRGRATLSLIREARVGRRIIRALAPHLQALNPSQEVLRDVRAYVAAVGHGVAGDAE